jgi:hypothetical protein
MDKNLKPWLETPVTDYFMSKSLNLWIVIIMGLVTVSGLTQVVVHNLIGAQLYYLDSYDGWFLTSNSVVVVGSALLLIYFYHRKSWFIFFAGVLNLTWLVLILVLSYWILRWHGPARFHTPLLLLYTASGMAFGIGLLFIRGVDDRWLRIAGIFVLLVALLWMILLVWGIFSHLNKNSVMATQMSNWLAWTACLGPIPYIVHFVLEGRRGKGNVNDRAARRPVLWWMQIVGSVCLLFTVIFMVALSFDCYNSIYWSEANHQQTRKLARLCEPGVFTNGSGVRMPYWVLKPLNYDPRKKYPLVVALPYGSDHPTDSTGQIDGAVGALLLSTDDNREAYPAFVFIPGRRPGAGWGGVPAYPFADSSVFDAISSLDGQYSIDDKRRYVIGLSLGAFGAWNFICMHPEMFAAAIPVSGGGDPLLAQHCAHVSVWAFHGSNDRNVPVEDSRNMINAMRRAGGNPVYTEYPGEGHNIWDKVAATPGLLAWLFGQQRE